MSKWRNGIQIGGGSAEDHAEVQLSLKIKE